MGLCNSCYNSGQKNTNSTTVKLVLLNGQLKQYSSPMKVFLVSPFLNSFICNANDMDFDSYIIAMRGDDDLQPGQLYFEVPMSWLNRRLTMEDMASLAVKAGRGILVSGGKERTCGCWAKRVDSLAFYDGDDDDDEVMMLSSRSRVGGGVGNDGRGGGGRGGGDGKGRLFTRLERIEEE